jgi:hypothetical protein
MVLVWRSCHFRTSAILNFNPGVHPFVHPHPGVNTLYCLKEWKGEQIISPTGDNFTPAPGDKIHSWGITSPLGSKFAPRGEVKTDISFNFRTSGIARL